MLSRKTVSFATRRRAIHSSSALAATKTSSQQVGRIVETVAQLIATESSTDVTTADTRSVTSVGRAADPRIRSATAATDTVKRFHYKTFPPQNPPTISLTTILPSSSQSMVSSRQVVWAHVCPLQVSPASQQPQQPRQRPSQSVSRLSFSRPAH